MMSGIAATITEFIAELGVRAAKEHCGKQIDEHHLKQALEQFVAKNRKLNEMCALTEEIDFQGLAEYILNDLVEDVNKRIFCIKKDDRAKAREEIVDAAVMHSAASTDDKRKRVARLVYSCIDIVRAFYSNDISIETYLIAADTVDAITEASEKTIGRTEKAILNAVEGKSAELIAAINSSNSLSMDRMVSLARAGEIDKVNDTFMMTLKHISVEHPLFPDYGYTIDNDRLVSVPMSKDALEKYPPRYVFKGTAEVNDANLVALPSDIYDYVYRHQLSLKLNVSEAKKMLGEIEDPIQSEAKSFIGKTMIAKPKEFPPAIPCSIKIGDTAIYDYVLMRIQEILDDGTFIIGNKEQIDFPFHIQIGIKFPDSDSEKSDEKGIIITGSSFKVSVSNASNKDLLKYIRFMQAIIQKKDIHIYMLEHGRDMMAGTVDDADYESGFATIDEEIDFMERVCDIEDYFDVEISIEDEIYEQQYNLVVDISELVRGNKISHSWDEATCTGIIDDNFRNRIVGYGQESYVIVFKGRGTVDLFGTVLDIPFERTFHDAVMKDIDSIRRKTAVLDNGDSIKINFVPGKDNTAVGRLLSEDEY